MPHIPEHLGQRNHGPDDLRVRPSVHTLDATASRIQIADSVSHERLGHHHFNTHDGLEQNRSRLRLRSLRLTVESQAALLAHQWPGNVRELEHLIGRAALKARSGAQGSSAVVSIGPEHLDLPTSRPTPGAISAVPEEVLAEGDLRGAVERYQTTLIRAALDRNQGNWAAAARSLGLDRGNLHRLAARLGLANALKPQRRRAARR